MDPIKQQNQGYIPFPSNTAGIKPSIPKTPKEDDLPPGLSIPKKDYGLAASYEKSMFEKIAETDQLPPGLSNPVKRESLAARLERKTRERQMEKMKEKELSLTPFEKPVTPQHSESTNPPNAGDLNFPKHSIDPGGEETKGFLTPEGAYESLKQHLLNPITLMNEVNSKIDPKFEPVGTELIVNKIKQFECNYVYEKQGLGFGKGGSKQEAKTKAAEETILIILKGETFPIPKKILISSIQKKINTIQKAQETPSEEKDSQNPEDKKRDILYELNLICQDNFIEPKWEVSDFKDASGEYEATLTLKEISTTAKGRKKIEARREAAHALLTMIKENKDFADMFFKKPKNKQAAKTQLPYEDFFKIVAERKFADSPITVLNQEAKDSIKNLEEYLIGVEKKHRLENESLELHLRLYNKVAGQLSAIFPSLESEKKEYLEYFGNCRFIPVGSFALDCLTQRDQISEVVLAIDKKAQAIKIPSKEILDTLKEKFDFLEQSLSNEQKLKTEVKKIDGSFCLEFQPESNKDFQLNVTIHDSPIGADNLKIQHVILIYTLIKPEKRVQFKRLMTLMRIWRQNRELEFIEVEVLDALLLNEFLNNKAESWAGYIKNILMILMSDEVCRSILRKFGEQYLKLYEKIPSKPRYKIVDFSTQSLAALSKNSKKDFEKSYFR